MAATRAALRRKINALLDEYEPILAKAFLASIASITATSELKSVAAAIEAGSLDGVFEALNLERAVYGPFEAGLVRAYAAGGTAMANGMPTMRGDAGNKIVVRFDTRNPRAEAWMRDHSSQFITQVLNQQRAVIQRTLEQGLARGQNPNLTALDLIGRIDPTSKQRRGGVIGLSRPQLDYVENARDELLSGDPVRMRHYFTRGRRDKRFDGAVRRAIKAGVPVDAGTAENALGRYADRLLRLRAEAIARTETMQAIHSAKHEAFVQGLGKTNYPPEAVTRTWRSASDTKVRHSHAAINGQKVKGLETPYISPSGAMLRYPGDTALGAPAEEIINCRCDDDYEIDFSFGVT